jgi:hypothetical protein
MRRSSGASYQKCENSRRVHVELQFPAVYTFKKLQNALKERVAVLEVKNLTKRAVEVNFRRRLVKGKKLLTA